MKKLLTILLLIAGYFSPAQTPTVTLRLPSGLAGANSTQTDTASATAGPTLNTFTFPNVPASYKDFTITVNGCKIRAITDYTKSGNVITIPTIVEGDLVEYVRIK